MSRLRKHVTLGTCLATAFCLQIASVQARDGSVVAVTAKVSPSAAFEVQLEAPPLIISDSDIARGYIDVTVRSRLGITTTRHAVRYTPGYIVEFVPRSDIFTSVLVSSPSESELEAAGAQFTYRFQLAHHVPPGNYSWPLSVKVEL